VEGRETLGGTCLNIGCIPSKALLHASHQLHEAEHNFAKMGLKGKAPSVDWKQMQAYKDDVIGQNTKGIEFLFKKNKIDWLKGWGSIPEAGKVKVGDEVHEAKAIVVASGSEPSSLPGIEIDEKVVVTSDRRAVAGQGAEEDGRDRRGRDRAGARLGLRAARLRGAGDRIPRPHHAGHGRGSVQDLPAAPERSRG
jgi:hypothetical protein